MEAVSASQTLSRANEVTPGVMIDEIATSDYYDKDFIVEVHVGDQLFKVASSRLKLHSPVFKEMFTLAQPDGVVSVTLHNEVDEVRDYLWYLHADPFTSKDFFDSPPSIEKCMRLLGIAKIAHMYDAQALAQRALNEAMGMLTAPRRPIQVDRGIARRILSLANSIRGDTVYQTADNSRPLLDEMIDVLCDAMYPGDPYQGIYFSGPLAIDPIVAVELAREVDNKDVLAHAYFYVLLKEDAYWKDDKRLDAYDRRRILCGSHALYGPPSRRGTAPELPWNDMSLLIPPSEVRTEWHGARVHQDIAARRDALWGFFDCEPWNLNQDR